MSEVPFERLFSMPTFEGLRVFRVHLERWPDKKAGDIFRIIQRTDANFGSYDLDAALVLHVLVPFDAPHSGVEFYKICLERALLSQVPTWAKLISLGRGRFIKRLKAPEYRDIRSVFRQARLLDFPPSEEDVAWWDNIQAQVKLFYDAIKMRRARLAEQYSLEYERRRVLSLAIESEPRWMAIEDNTVGYDILSFSPGKYGPVNRLIEVKSTIASPVRFYLSRNEWDQASKFGAAYVFHVWDLHKDPAVLHERTVADIEPHVPIDSGNGQWATALIRVV